MSTELTVEPSRTRTVMDADGDLWAWSDRESLWRCSTNGTEARSWDDLRALFGPIELIADPESERAEKDARESREFDIRRAALLAAAAVVGGCEEEYGEKVVTDLARKFEPYLRGEAK